MPQQQTHLYSIVKTEPEKIFIIYHWLDAFQFRLCFLIQFMYVWMDNIDTLHIHTLFPDFRYNMLVCCRWCRSTREPSSSGWGGCGRGAPRARASSSSCPASTPTRRSTSGPSASMFRPRRWEYEVDFLFFWLERVEFSLLCTPFVSVNLKSTFCN